MSTKTPIVIRADSVYWRATQRVLLLLMPYWLLVGGFTLIQMLAYFSQVTKGAAPPHLDLFQFLSIPSLVFATIILWVCKTNFVHLTEEAIKFPWLCSIKFNELENVLPHFNNGKATHLQFVYSLGRSLFFPINRLEGDRLDTLIKELNSRCRTGVMASDLDKIREEKFDLLPAQGYRIDYRTREKMNKLFKLVFSFEKQFWRAWLLVFITPVVLVSPFVLWMLYAMVTHQLTEQPPFANQMTDFYRVLNQVTIEPIKYGAESYYALMKHPLLLGLGAGAILACLAAFLRILCQPNLLVLVPAGLYLKVRMFGREHTVVGVPWSDISSFALFKPRNSTDTDHWSVLISTASGQQLFLKFSALATEAERRKFADGIDEYAPSASRDPELLQALAPANKRSYTELWLQSLAAPAERKNLIPLAGGQALAGGRYVVDDQIGVGGQGVAYLAYDRFAKDDALAGTSQKIVLKEFVLPVHVEKKVRQQSLERFEQESNILRTLDHPGIVKIVDNFVEDHRGYLVLEHIDGLSLRAIVAENGPMNPKLVLDLLAQMCSILAYVHSLSPPLVHRDFTPDNLILDKSGVLKLIDFNVAQQKQKGGTATVVGKHAYLPPEQFRGRPTTASDIFALGCTLYFLLTGTDPEPLTQSSLPSHLEADNSLPSHLEADNSLALIDRIIRKCTALDEAERYAGASEISELISASDSAKIVFLPKAVSQIDSNRELETKLMKEAQDG